MSSFGARLGIGAGPLGWGSALGLGVLCFDVVVNVGIVMVQNGYMMQH